jgi:hypothetical protein
METTYKDVSALPQYKTMIGRSYEVVGILHAYGIRKHSKATADYVVLQPPPGFAGSEVAFKLTVDKGSVLQIRRVFLTNRLFDPPLSIEVEFLNGNPFGARVLIDLLQGNQLANTNRLNPSIYRELR